MKDRPAACAVCRSTAMAGLGVSYRTLCAPCDDTLGAILKAHGRDTIVEAIVAWSAHHARQEAEAPILRAVAALVRALAADAERRGELVAAFARAGLDLR